MNTDQLLDYVLVSLGTAFIIYLLSLRSKRVKRMSSTIVGKDNDGKKHIVHNSDQVAIMGEVVQHCETMLKDAKVIGPERDTIKSFLRMSAELGGMLSGGKMPLGKIGVLGILLVSYAEHMENNSSHPKETKAISKLLKQLHDEISSHI